MFTTLLHYCMHNSIAQMYCTVLWHYSFPIPNGNTLCTTTLHYSITLVYCNLLYNYLLRYSITQLCCTTILHYTKYYYIPLFFLYSIQTSQHSSLLSGYRLYSSHTFYNIANWLRYYVTVDEWRQHEKLPEHA